MIFHRPHSVRILVVLVGVAVVAGAMLRLSEASTTRAESEAPQYAKDGKLLLPQNYREWIYLSSGFGMEYSRSGQPGSEFTNVFAKPSSYREFLKTGRWPDKTVFVLEERASATRGSINQGGHYQATLDGVAVSVKDQKRFPETWAYFSFRIGAERAQANPRAACFECHNAHGAVDNTFVQFYPTLKPVAESHGTYNASKAALQKVR